MRAYVMAFAAALAVSGCASTPFNNPFFDPSQTAGKHAVLHALNGEQRKVQGNLLNPFNSANWKTSIEGIKNRGTRGWPPLGRVEAVSSASVVPGSYTALVRCAGKGFDVWIDVDLPNVEQFKERRKTET